MESPPYVVTVVSSLKRENCSAELTREVYMINSEGEREAIPPQQDQDQPIRLLGQYIIPSGRLEKMCTLLHTTADQLLAGLRKRPSTDKVTRACVQLVMVPALTYKAQGLAMPHQEVEEIDQKIARVLRYKCGLPAQFPTAHAPRKGL